MVNVLKNLSRKKKALKMQNWQGEKVSFSRSRKNNATELIYGLETCFNGYLGFVWSNCSKIVFFSSVHLISLTKSIV